MRLVVDANILVAALIRSATTRQLVLYAPLTLFAPTQSFSEAQKVLLSPRVQRKSHVASGQELQLLLHKVLQHIQVISVEHYAYRLREALSIAPHAQDAPYLALALHLAVPLWSNDAALKSQTSVLVYNTSEILEILQ